MFFKAPHVTFRNGKPYFMIRVPTDLHNKFKSKFIRKSLKTTIPADAKMLAENMASRAKSSFTLLRAGILSEDQEKSLIDAYVCKRVKPAKRKSTRLSDLYDLYYAEKSPCWVGRTLGELNGQFANIVKVMGTG